MQAWQKTFDRKQLQDPMEIVRLIPNNSRVILGHAAGEPLLLVDALVSAYEKLKGIEIVQMAGMVLTVLQQVILLCLAFAWAGEEENRTWKQLQGISQSPMIIVIGKNIPYAVISMLWLLVFAYLLLPWSHVTDQIQLSSLLGFSLVFVAVMVSWGTWISVLVKDRLSATQALMFLSVPSFILSGYTWPFESLPSILQVLSFLLPLTHLATMFRGLYVTGADLSMYPDQLMMLLVFIIGHGGLAFWSVKRQLSGAICQSVSNQQLSDR